MPGGSATADATGVGPTTATPAGPVDGSADGATSADGVTLGPELGVAFALGLALARVVAAGAGAAVVATAIGWIDTHRPSQAIRTPA